MCIILEKKLLKVIIEQLSYVGQYLLGKMVDKKKKMNQRNMKTQKALMRKIIAFFRELFALIQSLLKGWEFCN